VPDAGHMVIQERPALVHEVIAGFLAAAGSARR
jgi:pimeloyl-ACP methyl ester carboxylesterase